MLLDLTESDMINDFGIKNRSHREQILNAIEAIKTSDEFSDEDEDEDEEDDDEETDNPGTTDDDGDVASLRMHKQSLPSDDSAYCLVKHIPAKLSSFAQCCRLICPSSRPITSELIASVTRQVFGWSTVL